jgi:hypothetical protein
MNVLYTRYVSNEPNPVHKINFYYIGFSKSVIDEFSLEIVFMLC